MTTWYSDTCECVIEFDDSQTLPNGRNKVKVYVNKCPEHSTVDLTKADDAYDIALGDNQRKNMMHGRIMSDFPALTETTPEGGVKLKPGISYTWSFSGSGKDRVLNVTLTGANLTAQQKTNLQTAANNQFGTGKVIITYV